MTRESTGGLYCHVLNRGNGQAEVFHDEDDYSMFVELLALACRRVAMRIAAVCVMPNHFHMVVRPHADGDLSQWMQWLMTSHVRRYHKRHGTNGHVWQGRFKSFVLQHRAPSADERSAGVVEKGSPLWRVVRYVERNPLRAGLVERAEDWPWSSLHWWHGRASRQPPPPEAAHAVSIMNERPRGWLDIVNRPQTREELVALRLSVVRSRPFGSDRWARHTAARLGLESTMRPRGRPPQKRGQATFLGTETPTAPPVNPNNGKKSRKK